MKAKENLGKHIVEGYIQPTQSPLRESETKQTAVFTTESKGFRIRRGHTIIIRRCKDIMRHLWQTAHKGSATREIIDQAIFFCAGGDYRTIRRYRGFYLSKAQKYIPGYLQRLRFIERVGERNGQILYLVNHRTLPYFRKQANFSAPSGSKSDSHTSKVKMCVGNSQGQQRHGERLKQHSTVKTQYNNTTTHTNRSSESKKSKQKPTNLDKTTDIDKNMSKLSAAELRILKATRRKEGS